MRPTIWERLGIDPASDRKAIRRAYAARLKSVHPEEDPEGFKALREAFELALSHAEGRIYAGADGPEALEPEPPAEPESQDWGGPIWPSALAPYAPVPSEMGDRPQQELTPSQADLEQRLHALVSAVHAEAEPDRLVQLLEELLASEAMGEVGAHRQMEGLLAYHLATTIPRSDPLLGRAIEYFGWATDEIQASRDWNVEDILARTREWQQIEWMSDPGYALHRGWRALTEPIQSPRVMRFQALSPDVVAQVTRLLDAADYELPGLRYHFDPERVQWWERFFAKPRMNFDTWLIAPAALLILLVFDDVIGIVGEVERMAGLAILPALALPLLYTATLKRIQHRWMARAEPLPGWLANGWILAALALTLGVALVPASEAAAIAAAGLAAALALWVSTVVPPQLAGGRLRYRIGEKLRETWGPALIAFIILPRLNAEQGIAWSALAVGAAFIWARAWPRLAALAARQFPTRQSATAMALSFGLAGLASVIEIALPERRGMAAAAVLPLGWVLLQSFWRVNPEDNKFPLVLGWLALIGAAFGWLPDPPRRPATQYSSQWPSAQVPGQAPPATGRGAEQWSPEEMRERLEELRPSAGERETAPARAPAPVAMPQARNAAPPPPRAVCPSNPEAAAAPHPPIPCGTPASWLGPGDYPAAALARGEAGTAGVTLSIGRNGRVGDCSIGRSSGSEVLDRATCRLMRERGRFLPARDAEGERVPSRLRFSMRWQIEG